MELQPYLFFNGRCEEAINFYTKTVGAELKMLARFKDAPASGMAPSGREEKVMHAQVQVGQNTLLVSDGHTDEKPNFTGFSLTLVADDAAAATRLFSALADGGEITMPLTKTFYSPAFGMLTDKFGVPWMIYTQ